MKIFKIIQIPATRVARKGWFFLSLLMLATAISGCLSPDLKPGTSGMEIELLDHQIAFILPAGWSVQFSEKQYFQLTAVARKGGYAPGIEYRGLNTDLTDKRLKDEYARGWYNAMGKNYPNWQYKERHEISENGITAYYFEGTFNEGELVLKKIGQLRFVNKKIHAIYFTAPLNEFDRYKSLFQTVDRQIRYLE